LSCLDLDTLTFNDSQHPTTDEALKAHLLDLHRYPNSFSVQFNSVQRLISKVEILHCELDRITSIIVTTWRMDGRAIEPCGSFLFPFFGQLDCPCALPALRAASPEQAPPLPGEPMNHLGRFQRVRGADGLFIRAVVRPAGLHCFSCFHSFLSRVRSNELQSNLIFFTELPTDIGNQSPCC